MLENQLKSINFVLHGRGAWAGEGGFVNNPHDPGGATNYGITIAELSLYMGRRCSVADVKGITPTVAQDIYRTFFWRPCGCDGLPAGVDLLAFDIAVNSGVGRAHQLLDSIKSARTSSTEEMIHKLDAARMGWFRRCRGWPFFKNGWTARGNAALKAALDLLHGEL